MKLIEIKRHLNLRIIILILKSANYRVVNNGTLLRNVKMMVALSNIIKDSYDDTSLSSRVIFDIKDTMEPLKNKKVIIETSYTEQSDSQKSAIMRTLNGHMSKVKVKL